ncbi:MAG: arsenosugar biosynthesis radical SAM protein ArsS [Salibacteraceae bacterium]|nr:arsenosugar biosynthesis radical SAM protein ArsS [Salibacteraceae bacterium]|tara:strand:+ start:47058 stop:48113 length:1056 start_codon:yes stop_codon:yes gene_type:complete
MIKSLKAREHHFSATEKQLHVLNGGAFEEGTLNSFQTHLQEINQWPLKPNDLEVFQVNVGYMCNQVCKHCHVDAGPDRKEIMTKATMQECIEVIASNNIHTLDLTGGAPEMNPNFRWFVESAVAAGVKEVIVRSNLTIILANPKYHDLPEFFAKNRVRVASSLPYYQRGKTDRQRGDGVFDKSIKALQMLNKVGYANPETGLFLDLVYNPSGAFLPGDQDQLQMEFKSALKEDFDIEFNNLFAITNLPISRFLDYLVASENYEDYMEKLVGAFNPLAVDGLMCKNTVSIDWKGYMYDCDFNQMLEMKTAGEGSQHISEFNLEALKKRNILVNNHCFGCAAGAGSSCQGTVA